MTSITSAVTIASSVSGLRTMRATTAMPSASAPTASPGAIQRWRAARGRSTSAAEREQPRGEDEEEGEARVGEARGFQIAGRVGRHEHLSHDRGEHEADDDADQPRRKERAEDVHRGRHGYSDLGRSSSRHALLNSRKGFNSSLSMISRTSPNVLFGLR